MSEVRNTKQYDLEKRTFDFAKQVRSFVKKLPKGIASIDDIKQLVRSSGSVGANYIEANEALSKKDFLMRIKISRKEAKESRYWLNLLETQIDTILVKEWNDLVQESTELMMIMSAIMRKSM